MKVHSSDHAWGDVKSVAVSHEIDLRGKDIYFFEYAMISIKKNLPDQ